jgi:hypothetical protein
MLKLAVAAAVDLLPGLHGLGKLRGLAAQGAREQGQVAVALDAVKKPCSA